MLRAILIERCKSTAPAAIADTDRQWFCTRAVKMLTYTDRGLAILEFDRNSSFLTAVSETLEIAETTPGSAATKSNCQLHAVRQIAERPDAAATRYRMYLGSSSCAPFPSFVDETDKAMSMQVEAVAAHQLLTVIGRVAPGALHSGSGARAGGGKAADDDDDDDDDGGGGKHLSKSARKKKAKKPHDKQLANRDAKKVKLELGGSGGGDGGGGGGRGGRGNGGNAPGDLAFRVKERGNSVEFTWPAGCHGQKASTKTFDLAAVKKSLAAASNADVSATKLCVGFQFMCALSSNFNDDDKWSAYAHRFCSHASSKHYASVTAGAHVQLAGLDRVLLLRHES